MAATSLIVTLLLLSSLQLAKAWEDLDPNEYQRAKQLHYLGDQFFDHYQNVTLKDLLEDELDTRAPTPQDLQCLADLGLVTQGLSSGSLWALRMLDSWGSKPSGVLYGNFKDLGNYDECVDIDQKISKSYSVKGKYCFAQISTGALRLPSLKTAVCFPASCTAKHMDNMLRKILQKILHLGLSAEVQLVKENTCKTSEREPFDGLTIFIIVVLAILAALVVLSTLYDYFNGQEQKLPPLIRVFSARANSRSLFRIVDSSSNPNVIDCLHGMRCLSLIWVIFGHDYMITTNLPNINFLRVIQWFTTPFSTFIKQGVFSVDTFFFLSGLLVVVIGLRSMERTKGKLNVPLMYLHRYLRLTPLLALAIPIYTKILPLLGEGPMFGQASFDDYSSCKDTWFYTLLYVQNYATTRICLAHSWYLSVDMQLYILAPVLLIALYKWGKKGAAGIFVLMLLLASCLFSMMMIKKYSMSSGTPEVQRKLYNATHVRASPYLVGVLFGYFLHVNRGKTFKLNPLTVLLGWIVGLGLLFTCMFSVYGMTSITTLEEASYSALSRIAWPLGLCWVVFACMHGYGGLANSFLSSPLWQPMSKLSYSAYIFHMLIESLNGGITRTSTYFSDYQVMLRFWGDFGFTLLLAYFMYILIEAPFGGLEGLLLPTRRPSPKPAVDVESKVAPDNAEIETQLPVPTITAVVSDQ